MKSVAIMMSVYNGERYLPEQIASILAQTNVDITLYIRDDGSDAPTIDLLKTYALQHDNIHVFYGPNLGIRDSFMKLLSDVPLSHDYYGFSDADDVFLCDKYDRAIKVMGKARISGPLAYCSQITLVNEKLNKIGAGGPLHRPIEFGNAVVECRMSGATAVFNKELIEIAQSLSAAQAVLHDAWMNLVATAFGTVLFDDESRILYRQHGRNADGGRRSRGQLWRERLGRAALFGKYAAQAESFRSQVAQRLSLDKLQVLGRMQAYEAGTLPGYRMIFDKEIFYQRASSKVLTAFALVRRKT
ncbi:MAG: glycosyltransferase [Sphingopyxis sp.]|nr:glycosyltransferase [Sphingopyxis sp.]